MPINVRQAIDSQTGERVKIIRKTRGHFEDGEWVEGQEKVIKAMASQQIVTPQLIEMFTGLERDKDMKAFYVNKTIIASSEFDNTEADHILWKGNRYRAMKLADWDSYGFNLVLGVRDE